VNCNWTVGTCSKDPLDHQYLVDLFEHAILSEKPILRTPS
jgi:hypothetical protein